MSGNSNNEGPPQQQQPLTPEQQAALQQAQAQEQQMQIMLLGNIVKDVLELPDSDDPQTVQTAQTFLREQQSPELEQILKDVLNPESRKKLPIFGLRIFNRFSSEFVASIEAAKDPRQAKSQSEQFFFAQLFGLLITPALRMTLHELGYKFEWYQAPNYLGSKVDPANQSKVVLS